MKRPTYSAARKALLAALAAEGWAVSASLKVPHATSPDGAVRLWFHAPALWMSHGASVRVHGSARSLWVDVRQQTVRDLIAAAIEMSALAG